MFTWSFVCNHFQVHSLMKAHRRFWENWMNHQQNRVWRQSSVECWLIWRMLTHMVRKLCVKLKHSIDMGNHSSFIAAQTIIWFLSRDGWIFLIHFFDVGLCANILFLVHYRLTRLNHTHTHKKKNRLVLFLQRQIFMIAIAITSVWYESLDFGSYMFTDQ